VWRPPFPLKGDRGDDKAAGLPLRIFGEKAEKSSPERFSSAEEEEAAE
jgi:hypothetical protein